MTSPDYDSPEEWAAGPDLVYGALAEAAVALLSVPPGSRVLDAGTGTGAVARALQRRGAEVVAVDASSSMLVHDAASRPPAAAGDLEALPIRSRCLHAAVAGFVLSHLADPRRGLAELARVTRPGGTVLATAFPAGPGTPTHPAKAAVDEVLTRYGYRPPDWYTDLKSTGEERVGTAAGLSLLATESGLDAASVERLEVDLTTLGNDALVRWRLGMAQVAPWLAAQHPDRSADIAAAVRDRLDAVPPTPLPMLVLRGIPAP